MPHLSVHHSCVLHWHTQAPNALSPFARRPHASVPHRSSLSCQSLLLHNNHSTSKHRQPRTPATMMHPTMAATCALVVMLLGVSRYVHTQPPSLLSILLLRTPTPGLTHVHHTHPPHTLTARTRRPPSSTPRSSARRGRPSPSRLRATPRTCTRSTSSSPS
jgi:hypothetical protein